MKTKKYINQHLGLGDHIVTAALIRHFCSIYDEVVLFCLPNIETTLQSLFKDLKNLEIFPIQVTLWEGDNDNIKKYIHDNKIEDDVITITNINDRSVPFDMAFYTTQGFDPSFRYSNFHYERDLVSEEHVYNTVNPDNEKYIFVIDDGKHYSGTNYVIDDARLPTGYKIIRHDKTLSFNDDRFVLFNYYKVLENAEEIHMIESAFTHFICSIDKLQKPKIYVYRSMRGGISSLSSKENELFIL